MADRIEEIADDMARALIEVDELSSEQREKFRNAFITAAEAEGALDVGSALAFLTKTMNEAFV